MADAHPGFDAEATTNLFKAIQQGDRFEAIRLLDKGADPNGTLGDIGNSPLMEAATYHEPQVIEALLKQKANPNYRRRNGDTALIMAALSGNRPGAQLIIEAGGDIYRPNEAGRDAVRHAEANGKPEMAAFLIAAAAEFGRTCLRQNISDIVKGGIQHPLCVKPFKMKGQANAL